MPHDTYIPERANIATRVCLAEERLALEKERGEIIINLKYLEAQQRRNKRVLAQPHRYEHHPHFMQQKMAAKKEAREAHKRLAEIDAYLAGTNICQHKKGK